MGEKKFEDMTINERIESLIKACGEWREKHGEQFGNSEWDHVTLVMDTCEQIKDPKSVDDVLEYYRG